MTTVSISVGPGSQDGGSTHQNGARQPCVYNPCTKISHSPRHPGPRLKNRTDPAVTDNESFLEWGLANLCPKGVAAR